MVNNILDIKPIETHYDGYRFRSRLEARWAVFFDALDIEWEYEKEGYDLGSAGWYLPDFWLPQVSMWVEVKGAKFTSEELWKCQALAAGSHSAVLLLDGVPKNRAYTQIISIPNDYISSEIVLSWGVYRKGIYWFMNSDMLLRRWQYHDENHQESGFLVGVGTVGEDMSDMVSARNAIRAARSARFEHGDHGKDIT